MRFIRMIWCFMVGRDEVPIPSDNKKYVRNRFYCLRCRMERDGYFDF